MPIVVCLVIKKGVTIQEDPAVTCTMQDKSTVENIVSRSDCYIYTMLTPVLSLAVLLHSTVHYQLLNFKDSITVVKITCINDTTNKGLFAYSNEVWVCNLFRPVV